MSHHVLVTFGQISRNLRIKKGYTMADQAKALNCEPSDISSYETGTKTPSNPYIQSFIEWIEADFLSHQNLIKSLNNATNVVSINSSHQGKSRRLYRKLNTLTPQQIRSLRIEVEGKADA
ncbi:helix-turn-helix transcriptional regulator [Mesorhizobium sp. M1322]|uniref:helix-turn-helix domain-containing protein n=1 Tax=Mesorhizobium sp. M1322 TaxID=2957081 RepID=UPI00333676C2